MLKNKPIISIIVPVYNAEKYLSVCLESLIGQTYENIEVICVNDGSTDHSQEILEAYEKKDERIVTIHQQNTGLSGARNAGLAVARGTYIMFVDSDDWIDVHMCEELYMQAQEEHADAVMCSYTKEFSDHSIENHIYEQKKLVYHGADFKERVYRPLFGLIGSELSKPQNGDILVSACYQLFNANLLQGIEFVDTKKIGTEDLLYQVMVYKNCKCFVYIDKPYYHYRRSDSGTLTTTFIPQKYERWQCLYDILEDFIQSEGLDLTYSNALKNRIAISALGLGLNEVYAKKSILLKAKRMKEILSSQRYQNALQQLDFQYFPLHWKLFFLLCKNKCTFLLMCMLECIEFLRKRVK